MTTLLYLLLTLPGKPDAPLVWRPDASSFEAWLIEVPVADNRDFFLLDAPARAGSPRIGTFFLPAQHQFMINGGYFGADYSPSGYCRIDGKVIKAAVNRKLSGFIALNRQGSLSLHTRLPDAKTFPSVLQSGPHVIDPGGKIGIRRANGRRAARTLIGRKHNGDIFVLVAGPIELYDLAHLVKKHMPDVERLLNLDGGPSTALRCGDVAIDNLTPVRNYLGKKRR